VKKNRRKRRRRRKDKGRKEDGPAGRQAESEVEPSRTVVRLITLAASIAISKAEEKERDKPNRYLLRSPSST
jgi:hypothetical protein